MTAYAIRSLAAAATGSSVLPRTAFDAECSRKPVRQPGLFTDGRRGIGILPVSLDRQVGSLSHGTAIAVTYWTETTFDAFALLVGPRVVCPIECLARPLSTAKSVWPGMMPSATLPPGLYLDVSRFLVPQILVERAPHKERAS